MGLSEGQSGTAALLLCQEEAEEQELDLLLRFCYVTAPLNHFFLIYSRVDPGREARCFS